MNTSRATIGVALVTKNEARWIGECLASVRLADRRVVVDSGSTDGTVEIARAEGATVIHREWRGYADQKQFALEQLDTDWVLALDGDEIVTPEAWSELTKRIATQNASGFRVPRYHVFLGRVLMHGRGTDYPLRLVRRGKARYSERVIHEEILVDGPLETLSRGIVHYSSTTWMSRLAKIKRDTDMELLVKPLPTPSAKRFLLNPIRYFASYLLKRGGWRDGWRGVAWTALFAYQMAVQEVKYWKAGRGRENPSRG